MASDAKWMRTALFWVITQRVVVIAYRRFGITYRSHIQGSRIKSATPRCVRAQKRAVFKFI